MSRKICDLTGPGTSSARFGVGGTDLGIARRLADGTVTFTFGDTFAGREVGSGDWRSPVILHLDHTPTPNELDQGLEFTAATGGDYARQVLPYEHGRGGISTVLPTDTVVLADGTLVLACMVIGDSGRLDDVRWTEMHVSDDAGRTFRHAGPGGRREGDEFGGMFQILTFEHDPAEDVVYTYSTGGMRGDRGVYLWRVPAAQLLDRHRWQSWGWDGRRWRWDVAPTNIMPTGVTVRELNLRRCQGQWLFTYLETSSGRIVTKVLRHPTDNIHTAPTYVIARNGAPWEQDRDPDNVVTSLYGGYLIPGSTLDNPHFVISQWVGSWPYRAMQFRGPAMTPVNPIPTEQEEPDVSRADDVAAVTVGETTDYDLGFRETVDPTAARPAPLNLFGAVKRILHETTLWQKIRDRATLTAQRDSGDTMYGMAARAASLGYLILDRVDDNARKGLDCQVKLDKVLANQRSIMDKLGIGDQFHGNPS